ncbi:hypothetical protein CC86DRAFT_452289 [Ophiobolus disseminans]|uniref:Uncharacterized protein n=1 Tax=Ophiobolus disseminans TaxID=1469910 RepID=A0A6A7AE27_9PLEO|nr:hypothetical protein CC86DRAFT_452289 [Ophiobolus disseminans]
MSDNETGAAAAFSGAAFTERELQMLGWAMQSLKTGPPEIDYDKLATFAGMSNPRSASNAWAKIKGKLMVNPDGTTIPTPKKVAGGKKKVAAKDDVEDSETAATPTKKTPRKRAAKKQDVDGDASPKKKGRAATKKASDDDNAKVKGAPDESEDLKPETKLETKPVKAEAAEDKV